MSSENLTPEELDARQKAYWAKYEAKQALKANGVEAPQMPSHKAELLRALLREKARRHLKAVNMYRPMGRQKEFHTSQAPERLALGSNRGGKTACCAMEVAWAALNCHPYYKYNTSDLRIICVAKDQTKIGEVMYRKLFRAGGFMMIKGRDGMFRAWNPKIDGYDRSKLKPSLPLIPPSEIKKIAWDKKSINCPKLVTLKNGTEISFYTSLGSPPNGVDVDMCLAGCSAIYDPVEGRYRRIDTIDGDFHVYSRNSSGAIEIRRATRPFIKGTGELVAVSLSNGKTIYTTRRHQVLAANGQWVSIQAAFDYRLPLADGDLALHSSLAGRVPAARMLGKSGIPSQSAECSVASTEREVRRLSASAVSSPTNAQNCGSECAPRETGTTPDCPDGCSVCPHPCDGRPFRRESDARVSPPLRGYAPERTHYCWIDDAPAASREHSRPYQILDLSRFVWSAPCPEARTSGLKPQLEPALGQPAGIQKRSGHKSLRSSASRRRTDEQLPADQANAMRACDISSVIHVNRIDSLGEGAIWDIGVEENHNYLYGGTVSHNCWFDEEIEGKEWYDEMAARLLDRAGRFIWSATPQSATEKLHDLHEASEIEKGNPNPRIQEFHFLLDDNPFIPPEQKEIFKAKAAMDPDEYKVRVLGQFLILTHRVYPNFSRAHHTCQSFEIPPNWCRYMVLDPGFANICAIFFAVAPPEDPNYGHVYAYDELHVHAMDAKTFAGLLKHKVGTQAIQAFLIDAHGARRTEVVGKSIGLQFAEQLEGADISSIETGSNFLMIGGAQEMYGRETLKHQVQQTRSWLWPRDDLAGRPILQIFSDTCPTLIEQMIKYKNKVDKGKPTDQPDGREYSHGPDCVRYACLHGVPYVEPKKPRKKASGAVKAMAAKRRKKRMADGSFILMGSGAR